MVPDIWSRFEDLNSKVLHLASKVSMISVEMYRFLVEHFYGAWKLSEIVEKRLPKIVFPIILFVVFPVRKGRCELQMDLYR